MAQVQMLTYISGGRGDGSAWPHPDDGGLLVCGQAEAEHLVAARLARWVPGSEERAVMPADGAETAAGATSATPPGDESQGGENGAEGSPLVRDPKQDWVDHATAQGASAEAAAAMTKADLIAKYGNPA